MMMDVSEALAVVLERVPCRAGSSTPLTPAVLGQALAEDVRADRDSPPFDKSLRDGFAVRSMDCVTPCELRVVEAIAAGATPRRTLAAGECSRLFTGAPIPPGADAVVMQEETQPLGESRVRITQAGVPAGQWIFRRGQEMREGDVVLPRGTVLGPAALGVLANVGRTTAVLIPRPRVGIIATGNELVEPGTQPGASQIRNSNGPMLMGQATAAGANAKYWGIGRDDPTALRHLIEAALAESDVLLLAGGVSVGDHDHVPAVLADLGMTAHVRQVRMKPGKPLLFGTRGETLIFGLPGNPVSSFVCFELFVKPALRRMMGYGNAAAAPVALPLGEALTQSNDRPTFHPARWELTAAGATVRPLTWGGAPDLRGLQPANALLALPAGTVRYNAGDAVSVILLGSS